MPTGKIGHFFGGKSAYLSWNSQTCGICGLWPNNYILNSRDQPKITVLTRIFDVKFFSNQDFNENTGTCQDLMNVIIKFRSHRIVTTYYGK